MREKNIPLLPTWRSGKEDRGKAKQKGRENSHILRKSSALDKRSKEIRQKFFK